MPSVLYVTADAERLEKTKKLFAHSYPEIDLLLVPSETDGQDIARIVEELGVEVVIARGAIYSRIKKLGLSTAVLEAPVTSLDTLRALKTAQYYGNKVAAVASRNVMVGASELAELMGLNLTVFPLDDGGCVDEFVEQAKAEGAEIVIGGFIAKKAAEEAGLPCVVIVSHEEGLFQAAREASAIVHAVRQEKQRSSMVRVFMDYTSDGIIAADSSGKILLCNPSAERFCGVHGVEGGNVDELLPELGLMATIREEAEAQCAAPANTSPAGTA